LGKCNIQFIRDFINYLNDCFKILTPKLKIICIDSPDNQEHFKNEFKNNLFHENKTIDNNIDYYSKDLNTIISFYSNDTIENLNKTTLNPDFLFITDSKFQMKILSNIMRVICIMCYI